MGLSEWKTLSDQFLEQAEQTLPAWLAQSMRITQETIMRNHLESGFLTLEPQTPLERAMASDPFKNVDFSVSVDPKDQPFSSADNPQLSTFFKEDREAHAPWIASGTSTGNTNLAKFGR